MKKTMNYLSLKLKFNCILILVTVLQYSQAQTNDKFDLPKILERYHLKKFSVKTTDFVVYKKNDLPKPTIVFIRGSDFIPLFVNGDMVGAWPVNIYKYGDDFNFVILQKPGIPIASDSISNRNINFTYEKAYYLNPNDSIPLDYINNNNMTFYTESHNEVISFLYKQAWVDKNKIIVMGHSQGSNVAANIAVVNDKVSKVVLLSSGFSNRFYKSIRQIRLDESVGAISGKRSQEMIDSVYKRFSDLYKNRFDKKRLYDNTTYFSYASFTFPSVKDNILKIKQPALIVYGTNSIQDLDADYLPLEITEHGKTNMTVKAYQDHDHNFFEYKYNDKGELISKNFNYEKVLDDVLEWVKK